MEQESVSQSPRVKYDWKCGSFKQDCQKTFNTLEQSEIKTSFSLIPRHLTTLERDASDMIASHWMRVIWNLQLLLLLKLPKELAWICFATLQIFFFSKIKIWLAWSGSERSLNPGRICQWARFGKKLGSQKVLIEFSPEFDTYDQMEVQEP